MAATTADRNTTRRESAVQPIPVAADEVIPAGSIVGIDANGFAEAAVAGSAAVAGVAEERVDNTGGANGDVIALARRSVFLFENDDTNPVVQADIGQQATLVDNQTVATPGGAGPNAGRISELTAAGVWVDMSDIQ